MDPTLRSGPSAGLPFHPGTNSTVWILLARSLYSLTQRKQNCFQHTCWNTVYRPCDARLRPRLHGHKPQENHNFSPPCKWKPRDIQRIEHIGVVKRVEVLSGSSCLYTTWFPESTQDAQSREEKPMYLRGSPCMQDAYGSKHSSVRYLRSPFAAHSHWIRWTALLDSSSSLLS
jgi:hypothetical protein